MHCTDCGNFVDRCVCFTKYADEKAVFGGCEVCYHDPRRDAAERYSCFERVAHYRRALYIACGNDRTAVLECMQQAEADMTPNAHHNRPSDSEVRVDGVVMCEEKNDAPKT